MGLVSFCAALIWAASSVAAQDDGGYDMFGEEVKPKFVGDGGGFSMLGVEDVPKRMVRADPNGVRAGFPIMNLRLIPGVNITAEKNAMLSVGNGTVWSGEIAGGDMAEKVTLVATAEGAVYGHAIVKDAATGQFKMYEMIPSSTDPTTTVIMQAPIPDKDDKPVIVTKEQREAMAAKTQTESAPTIGARTFQAAAATTDSGAVVDVIMVYTQKVMNKYGKAGIEAKIMSAIADTNQAFINSKVPITFALVYTGLVNYVEDGDLGSALGKITDRTDGIADNLHTLRDQYKADMVQMVTEDANYCGVGYLMGPSDVGDPTSFRDWAFSTVSSMCLNSLTPAHEWGHNMGLHHDRANGGGDPAFPYAYGYRECGREGGIQTIMAYYCSGVQRIPYFSNPDNLYQGRPTGISHSTNPGQSADNARALRGTAWTVANWRVSGTGGNLPTAPAAPANLAARATSHSQVVVTWGDVASETGYQLWRLVEGSTEFVMVATLGANVVSFTDNGLIGDTDYSYKVKAMNSVGSSTFSNTATAVTPIQPPAAPTVTAAAVGNAVSLSISPGNGGTPSSYVISRSANGAIFATLTTQPSQTYADTTVLAGSTYAYRVQSSGAAGTSGFSNTAVVTLPLSKPTNLAVESTAGTSAILQWDDVPGAVTGYNVTTLTAGAAPVVMYTTESMAVVSNLTPNTAYTFTVAAFNNISKISSPPSDNVQTTTTDPEPLTPPAAIEVVATSPTTMYVVWAPVLHATGYSVTRVKLVAGSEGTTEETTTEEATVRRRRQYPEGTTSATFNVTTNRFNDTGLSSSTAYSYTVVAFNKWVESAPSQEASNETADLVPPTGFAVGSFTATSVLLKWTPVRGVKGYTITRTYVQAAAKKRRRQAAPKPNAVMNFNVTGTASTFSDVSVAPGSVYKYVISSFTDNDESLDCAPVSVTTPFVVGPRPVVVKASQMSSRGVPTSLTNFITWAVPAGVAFPRGTAFLIYRQVAGGNFGLVGTLQHSARAFIDRSVAPGTTYGYRVQYLNGTGVTSQDSNTVVFTTAKCNFNGRCEAALGESCSTCQSDCLLESLKNDGVCQAGNGENCLNSPNDCKARVVGKLKLCCGTGFTRGGQFIACNPAICGKACTTRFQATCPAPAASRKTGK